MAKAAFREILKKRIRKKIAIGTKRNRLRNLSKIPDIWMKPNMLFELGSAGVNTTNPRAIK
jgi:hypothetical protein